jgi:hypothetical protein
MQQVYNTKPPALSPLATYNGLETRAPKTRAGVGKKGISPNPNNTGINFCLPATGFDEINKRKPEWEWVEFNNKRAKVNY